MLEQLTPHIPAILTFIGGIGAWGYERTKRHQELKAAKTEHQNQIMDMYQEALSDLKTRYDEKFAEMQKEIEALREEVKMWKGKYQSVKKPKDNQ